MNYAFREPDPRRRRGIDPITGPIVASLVVEGLLAVGGGALSIGTFNAVAAAVTNLIGFAAIAGGSALLASGGQSAQIRPPEAQRRSYELEDGPRIVVLGRARVGGVFALRASTGFDTYRLLAQCEGPVDGIEEYYVSDRVVVVEFDGAVSSPPYAKTGGSYLHLFSKLGTTDQTAFTELTTAFSANWTSDHRGRGVMHTLGQFTSPGTSNPKFLQVWPEGYPQFDTLVRGVKVYDPREDSTTEEGSGSQRTNDDTTWTWSDNGVLCVLWHCTASEEKGGFGLSFDQFDLDDIAGQAELADAAVDSKAGVGAERRSVCSGSYTTDTPRGDVLANILLSTGTRIVRLQNGKYSIRLDEDNPTSTVTIKRRNIIDTIYGGDEVLTEVNQLNLLFVSPERNWQMAELAIQEQSWARDTDSIAKTGKRTETLSLKFCPQPGQAQRIARRVFSKRRAPRGEVVTNLAGLISMGHIAGTVELDALEDDYHPVVEFGSHRFLENKTSVQIPLIFIPTLSAWSVDDDEVAAPVALEDIQFSGDIPAPEISRVVAVKTGAGGTDINLRLSHTASSGATGYEATYRTWDGSVSGPRLGMTEDDGVWAESDANVPLATRYLVQVRAFNGDGDVSNFSPTVDYTTAYDTTAPTGLSLIVTEDWNHISESPFTATIFYGVDDINVSTVAIDKAPTASGPWTPVLGTTYATPYADGVTTTAETGPNTGGGLTKEYFYRLTATNSTGQSTTAQFSFVLP